MVSPQAKRVAVGVLMTERGLGVTRACGLMAISRSLYRYRSRRPDSALLRARIEAIAAVKRRSRRRNAAAKRHVGTHSVDRAAGHRCCATLVHA